jgi:hypothetical protein
MKFRFVFWDVLPFKIIVDRHFKGTCCLHHRGDELSPWWWRQHVPLKRRLTIILYGSTSQKTNLNSKWKLANLWRQYLSYCLTVLFYLKIRVISSAVFSFKKKGGRWFRNAKNDPKFGRRMVVLVIPKQGKKGSGTPFRLAYFWERTSGVAFRCLPSPQYPWF